MVGKMWGTNDRQDNNNSGKATVVCALSMQKKSHKEKQVSNGNYGNYFLVSRSSKLRGFRKGLSAEKVCKTKL